MRRGRKVEAPEQTIARWMADPCRVTISHSLLSELGWEPGQTAYVSIQMDGCEVRYEQFYLSDKSFCVIEWDVYGNLVIA